MIVTLLMVGALASDLATLDHAALVSATHSIASDQLRITTSLVGTSRSGLAIEALSLEPKDAPGDRPALLLVAGLTGAEAFSSSLALHHARALAEGYGSDEGVTALLDACTVHVIPRANPDAIEAFFATPRLEVAATGYGVDDDRDGMQGEDPLQDVDGDGLITWMRFEDPEGEWLADPTDPRALVEPDREEGQRGKWKLVREARDLDGDESTGEDGMHNAVVNRNFPAGWEEHQADVGLWPADEPEVRGLIEFVLGHRNLIMVVAYDAQGNMVELPKSVKDDAPSKKRIPPSGIRETDRTQLERIGERYTELTGSEVKGESEGAGSFQRWAYEHRGLLVLGAKPWELPSDDKLESEDMDEDSGEEEDGSAEADDPGPGAEAAEAEAAEADVAVADDAVADDAEADDAEADDAEADEMVEENAEEEAKPSDAAKRLAWIDARPDEAWRFAAWTAFEHPELGPVEIGGLTPFASTEPPMDERLELAQAHLAWFVTLADEFPQLEIASFQKQRLGDGLWQVELVLENTGRMPLLSKAARTTRTIRPARVTLMLPEAATLLAGRLQHLVSDLAPIDGRFEATWLVQASDATAIGIEIDTDHAGDLTANAEDKP